MERLIQRLERLFIRLDRSSRGVLSLLVRAGLTFDRHEGPVTARSIAYYTLFSTFPLLLALVVVAGSVLEADEVQQVVSELVANFVPIAGDIVEANIANLVNARTTMSLVAIVALFWSASGMFIAVYRAVNRIWENPKSELFWAEKLFGLAVTFTIGALLLVAIIAQAGMSIMRSWFPQWSQLEPLSEICGGLPSGLLTIAIPVGAFIVLYRIVPRGKAAWRDVWLGGLIAGLAWVFITWLFAWYVAGVVRSNPIYGSVGGIAAFLLWSYWSALVLLVGAGFTAQYSRWREAGRPLEQRPLREWMAAWPE